MINKKVLDIFFSSKSLIKFELLKLGYYIFTKRTVLLY